MSRNTPMLLPVTCVTQGLQRVGVWAGMPAVFVRLAAPDDQSPLMGFSELVRRSPGVGEQRAEVTDEFLTEFLSRMTARHVVIAGPEPAHYDLMVLTTGLREAGKSVQVETMGTQDIRVGIRTWVTLTPSKGELTRPTDRALLVMDEIVMQVGTPGDVMRLRDLLATIKGRDPAPLVWLRPEGHPRATALCLDAATVRGWRVAIG